MPTSAIDYDVVTDHDLDLFLLIEELEQQGCEHSQHHDPAHAHAHGGEVRRAVRTKEACCPRGAELRRIFWVCDVWWNYIDTRIVAHICGKVFSQRDYEVLMTREV